MKHTSIVVDLRSLWCEWCGERLRDELATVCRNCGASFDTIISDYPGLAAKLTRRREEAGIFGGQRLGCRGRLDYARHAESWQ
jgi:hypothetical protein